MSSANLIDFPSSQSFYPTLPSPAHRCSLTLEVVEADRAWKNMAIPLLVLLGALQRAGVPVRSIGFSVDRILINYNAPPLDASLTFLLWDILISMDEEVEYIWSCVVLELIVTLRLNYDS